VRHRTRAGRRAGRILIGLAALATLLALVAAVPAILLTAWRILGPPLPSLHELSGPDDGTLFVRVLCLVGWLGWATFTWSVLAEILAQWRGWHLPAFGWQRRTAAGLVTAITMMLSSPAVAVVAMPVRAAPVVALPPHTPAAQDEVATPATSGATQTRTTGYVEHVVAPGEQLPTLAQRFLGDKYQWHAIATATYGLQQPDGRILRPGDTRVYPGWTVRIPNPAITTAAYTTATTRSVAPTYEVKHGDWLWYIAQRFLGDPERYPEIAQLNPDLITATSGVHGPDHIEGGWKLTLPVDARDRGAHAHAAGTLIAPRSTPKSPGDTTPPGGTGTAGGTAPGGPGTTVAPTAPPSPVASPSATLAPSPSPSVPVSAVPSAASASPSAQAASPHPGGSTPAPRTANGHQAEDGSMLDTALLIGVPLVGAGLLATLLLITLRRRRHRQTQHRPVGRRLPEPAAPRVETQLQVVAEPAAVDRLDHALRALAAGLIDRPADQMPDIVGAWLGGATVNLLLTAPCPNPPTGWVADQLTWTLPEDVVLPEVDGQLAPLPILVAVGSQPSMHVLLDLERLGLLAIGGDPDRAGDLLRYLAGELSLNTWSDHVQVTIAGFDATQTSELLALGADRMDAAPSIAIAIERIRRRAGQVIQSLDHLNAADPVTGRINDIAADAWMPHVLLINHPSPQDITALEALDSDLADTGRCAVAIAVATNTPIGRWPVTIDPDGAMSIGFLGMSDHEAIPAARLPQAELTNLADLLTTARRGTPVAQRTGQPDPDPDLGWPPVPPAPEPEPWADGTDAAGALLTDEPEQPADQVGAVGRRDQEDEEHDPTDDEAPEPDQIFADPLSPETHQRAATGTVDEPAAYQPGHGDNRAQVPAVVALVGPQPARKRITTPARPRRHSDPTLEADLRAWTDADPDRPRIAILGPVTVQAHGQIPDERVRFYAEIIVYLATRGRRGATTDQFDDAIWPDQQVKANTRRVAVARARRWLGDAPDGQPWLPDATADRRYRLRDGFLLDWHLFRRLRSRGESRGPAGTNDLRDALSLVRGAPLASADVAYSPVARNPYVWLPTSEIQPHHLAAAVVDTAHRLVELCLDGGDITGARWAVDQAWLADAARASDIAWRDLLRVAAAEGNTAELDQLLGELMTARDAEVPEDLDRDTYRLLCDLMPERMRAGIR
jgi:nucleoid-associated protein YgaU